MSIVAGFKPRFALKRSNNKISLHFSIECAFHAS